MLVQQTSYTFTPSVSVVTSPIFSSLSLEQVRMIADMSQIPPIVIYGPEVSGGSLTNTTLSLAYPVATFGATDRLMILYDDGKAIYSVGGTVSVGNTVTVIGTVTVGNTVVVVGTVSVGNTVTATISGTVAVAGTVTIGSLGNIGGSVTVVQGNAGTTPWPVAGTVTIGSLPNIGGTVSIGTTVTVNNASQTGIMWASNETGSIYSSTTALTPKWSTITASTSGANNQVSAVSNKKIRVIALALTSNGTVNVKFQSHVTPTDKTGLFYEIANTGFVLPYNPVGWFETISGEALDINLSGSVAVGGVLAYIEV